MSWGVEGLRPRRGLAQLMPALGETAGTGRLTECRSLGKQTDEMGFLNLVVPLS